MSETLKKQYMLVLDDIDIAFMAKVMPSIKFVEIQGADLKDSTTHKLLVMPVPEAPKQPEPVNE